MIHIGKPYLGEQEGRPALRAQVQIREKQEEIWFSVDPEYGEYLTDDRLDAFVVSLLPMAMRQGLDICCQAPITRRLHYQLTEYLIPGLAAGTPVFHSIALHAPVTDAVLPRGNGVGTGWSGGVDSMYTLMSHLQREEPQFRLTHLLIANIGTLESEDNRWMLAHMAEEARGGIAGELGLPVITLDSNVQLVLQETYLSVAGFRLPAAVLALQKLFRVFLHSGGYSFGQFSIRPENSARYELLLLSCFETDNTVFYSTGSQVSRTGKLRALSEFPPAWKYLHPCIYATNRKNCGRCAKCARTQGALDILGTLDRFEAVFDLEDYRTRRDLYQATFLAQRVNPFYDEILCLMEEKGMSPSPEVQRIARILRAAEKAEQNRKKGENTR